MGHSMKRLCTICARGGSKGLPNKNIRQMVGKPLIAHSILQAKSSGLFEAIAVSSDSKEILDISKKFGADYSVFRPKELASDTAPKLPAIQHCVNEVEILSGENDNQFRTIELNRESRRYIHIRIRNIIC